MVENVEELGSEDLKLGMLLGLVVLVIFPLRTCETGLTYLRL